MQNPVISFVYVKAFECLQVEQVAAAAFDWAATSDNRRGEGYATCPQQEKLAISDMKKINVALDSMDKHT